MWNIFCDLPVLAEINLTPIMDLLTGDFLELLIVVLIISMIIGLFGYIKIKH